MWSQLPRLHALSSGFTRVSCYTTWVRDILHVISHVCHKSEERCECLKESSKQQCEVFLPASGGFWLAEGILGPLSLLRLTEAGNRSFDIRDLKQSGRQRQRRLRLKNEFLPLIRISKMAARVYRLIRRHTSTSA